MSQKTLFGNDVKIPNCPVCKKWIGKPNCKDDEMIGSTGAFIIKTKCTHFYHGNCCKKNGKVLHECIVCSKSFKEIERINLHHTDWWVVEAFWKNNFTDQFYS